MNLRTARVKRGAMPNPGAPEAGMPGVPPLATIRPLTSTTKRRILWAFAANGYRAGASPRAASIFSRMNPGTGIDRNV